MKTKENWKDIPKYEGLYQVSNLGRVKSLNYNRTGREEILEPFINIGTGTSYVKLCKDGVGKNYNIQNLVSEIFSTDKSNEGGTMKTFNNKIFEILSDLVDIIIEDTVLETDPEKRKSNTWYPAYLHNVVIDEYWRDPQRERLSEAIAGITPEKISTSIRLYLNKHDYLGGLKYLAECCGCSEETITEFGILYQTPILNSEENEEINALRLENIALKEEIERLKKLLQTPKRGFSKDNITEDSVKSAKVRISLKKSGYENTYDCIEDLLEAENLELEPTVKNGFKGLANILKERSINGNPSDTFVCISLKGYRIDFIYEI